MNISTAQKTKTGLFVVFAFLLLGVLIFLIGKQNNLFGSTYLVHADFKNIAGTQEGNYVRYAGINIGTVESIGIRNDTTVRLTLKLEKEMQKHIKSDAVASIGSDGLMGDKLIIITPGDSSQEIVKEGGVLNSNNPMDVDRIMGNLSRISDNAESMTGGLANIVAKINNGEGTIGRLIADDKLADNMESTLAQAKATAAGIKKTAANVDEGVNAAKSNFLLRGYFKKKERKRIADSTAAAKKTQAAQQKKTEEKKEEKKENR